MYALDRIDLGLGRTSLKSPVSYEARCGRPWLSHFVSEPESERVLSPSITSGERKKQ